MCKNPDVKCSVVERFNRTLKTKMFKYFTYHNSYRYVDVLDKFLRAYNNTVHRSMGMAPSQVNAGNVLQVWRRLSERWQRGVRPVRFHVGQTVRISKEKMKFAKGFDKNYSTEVFRVARVIRKYPQPVYELVDLNDTPIDGRFYNEELTPVTISSRTEYKIDRVLSKRRKAGRLEYLVRWKGYTSAFDSWIPASNVKRI